MVQATAGFRLAARQKTGCNDDGVHGAGACAADGVEREIFLFEQAVENAPGESAQRSPALKGERDTLRRPARWFRSKFRDRAPGDSLRATWATGVRIGRFIKDNQWGTSTMLRVTGDLIRGGSLRSGLGAREDLR